MDKKRRNLLKGGIALGGVGAFAAGYLEPLTKVAVGLKKGTAGEPTLDKIVGNALTPSFASIRRPAGWSAPKGRWSV